MVPESIDKTKYPKPPTTDGSRDIKPHVSHLVLKNLQDISQDWWDEIKELLNSKHTMDRKFAITEINKIQLKSMPNTISADEGVAINVNIINYGNTDPAQLHPKVVSGTVIDSD